MSNPPKPNHNIVDAIRSKLAQTTLANRSGLLARKAGPMPDVDSLIKHIIVPSLPITDEEMARTAYKNKGQKLARQEMWHELSELIENADDGRLATPGGENATMLLSAGARNDVVAAAQDALCDGSDPDPDGIAALEEMLTGFCDDYASAIIVALAHIDIGWAWRTLAQDKSEPERELHFRAHFKRADNLLAPFDPVDLDSPALAVAHCALIEAQQKPEMKLTDSYERLIKMDPDSPRHMRAFGRNLLPDRFGSYEQLEHEARKTALHTSEVWGAGGYSWTYLDALALDQGALCLLDSDFFINGLHDILARKRDQYLTNLLAAFCAIAMAPPAGNQKLPAAAENSRAGLQGCLDWILASHLQELHPLVWSQAMLTPGLTPALPPRQALVAKGRHTALRVIAERFAEDIADGGSITFSSDGMYRVPAL